VAGEDEKSGVTAPRLSVLSVLVLGGGPRTVGALAKAERVTAPSMTRLVQAMERDGLVRRADAPHDARAVHITATSAGEKILKAARERRLERLNDLLSGASPQDLDALGRAVDILEPLVAKAP
jgi:DNA-binding MarR family transcriptional regulator